MCFFHKWRFLAWFNSSCWRRFTNISFEIFGNTNAYKWNNLSQYWGIFVTKNVNKKVHVKDYITTIAGSVSLHMQNGNWFLLGSIRFECVSTLLLHYITSDPVYYRIPKTWFNIKVFDRYQCKFLLIFNFFYLRIYLFWWK